MNSVLKEKIENSRKQSKIKGKTKKLEKSHRLPSVNNSPDWSKLISELSRIQVATCYSSSSSILVIRLFMHRLYSVALHFANLYYPRNANYKLYELFVFMF